ncbi:hypothetical protein QQF64_002145 [Cirrhinus molitorella]|uniref:Uncharacterized protein n=1 Tax=Cirrhinus molitorella TaxID=172907 RepID=A0ABR3MPH4_9TELE
MWSCERKLEKVELPVNLSEPHSPELETLSTPTQTDSLWSVERREVQALGLGSVPARKKERERTACDFYCRYL